MKVPKQMTFKTLEELDNENLPAQDENLLYSDFENIENNHIAHYIYQAYLELTTKEEYYEEIIIKSTE